MAKKLNEAQAQAVLAVIRESKRVMKRYQASLDELIAAWAGNGFKEPVFEQRQDGVYIVEQPATTEAPPVDESVSAEPAES